MTLLGKNYIDDIDYSGNKQEFDVPSVYNKRSDSISFMNSLLLSVILHPTFVMLVAVVMFVMTLLGVTFVLFEKPEPKLNDIEFVLVHKEATPINKKTPYRADINSRAGGKHDPKKKVSEPSPVAKKSKPMPAAAPTAQPNKTIKKQAQSQPSSQVMKKVFNNQAAPAPKAVSKPVPKPVQKPQGVAAPPAPNVPRPMPKVSAPRPTTTNSSSMAVPFPKVMAPTSSGPAGGPVTGAPNGISGTSRTAGSSYGTGAGRTPGPSFSPSGSGAKGRYSSGGSYGGNYGNPGPGNPNGAPGVDAVRNADFGPYMRELQRRIKMNWDPPKGNESKRVVLMFRISKSGRLLSIKTIKSSGVAAADRAAIQAVQLTAPFKPLPPEYRRDSVDIQFTFDYNVFGASTY